jgi:hypothetical protein
MEKCGIQVSQWVALTQRSLEQGIAGIRVRKYEVSNHSNGDRFMQPVFVTTFNSIWKKMMMFASTSIEIDYHRSEYKILQPKHHSGS